MFQGFGQYTFRFSQKGANHVNVMDAMVLDLQAGMNNYVREDLPWCFNGYPNLHIVQIANQSLLNHIPRSTHKRRKAQLEINGSNQFFLPAKLQDLFGLHKIIAHRFLDQYRCPIG
ncbi:hypothetical protein D3C87_1499850 [compost metagenome]